jgi:transposase
LFRFLLTPGNVADITAAHELTASLPSKGCLLADTAYDATKLRQDLAFRGIGTVIPTNPTRKYQWPIDRQLYKQRNLVERMFNRLKDYRRIATRYDKLARNFSSAIALVAIVIWWTD